MKNGSRPTARECVKQSSRPSVAQNEQKLQSRKQNGDNDSHKEPERTHDPCLLPLSEQKDRTLPCGVRRILQSGRGMLDKIGDEENHEQHVRKD
jgi:hypothetical protein